MNTWLIVILVILLVNYLLNLVVSILNIKALSPNLPKEFSDYFDDNEYAQSQLYTRTTTRFSLYESSFSLVVTIIFILIGGFNIVDGLARGFGYSSIMTGLIFTAILTFFSFILSLPFSIYSTFVIEEKFGFNKTTAKTFFTDMVKAILLTAIIGGPILALILWFFENAGTFSWLYCWLGVVALSIILQFLAPVLIMPLFNKFIPLEEGELKEQITAYAAKTNFAMQGVFTMDGSKRSTKLNAFFTGFGRFRKIVFFDTLVEKLSTNQIVAVLAHEMGHFKLKHIYKMLLASVLQTGLMFFLLSLILNNTNLFEAFKMDHVSIYASLIFFGFLYAPVSFFVSILFNIVSRRHEYEADAYASVSCNMPGELISGLKTLSQANLSNLTPHPLHVFLNYSHPPVLDRIIALKNK